MIFSCSEVLSADICFNLTPSTNHFHLGFHLPLSNHLPTIVHKSCLFLTVQPKCHLFHKVAANLRIFLPKGDCSLYCLSDFFLLQLYFYTFYFQAYAFPRRNYKLLEDKTTISRSLSAHYHPQVYGKQAINKYMLNEYIWKTHLDRFI